MYLWRKDSGFFFQIRIPTNRVETMGKGHVRIWLGRMTKREATRAAIALAGAAQTGFEIGMDRETLTRSLKALADEIEALKRKEFASGLSAIAAHSQLEQASEDGNTHLADTHREKVSARSDLLQ